MSDKEKGGHKAAFFVAQATSSALVDALAATVVAAVDLPTPLVHAAIDAITLVVETTIDLVALAIEAIREPITAGCRGRSS